VIDAFAGEAPVLVGSSMGGWIALLVAQALRARGKALSGLVLIAPAADFTEALIYARLGPDQRRAIDEEGVWWRPSAYGDPPYPITRALIEDGRRHLVLGAPITVGAPVRVLQGLQDPDVPWRHTLDTVTCMADDDVVLTLIKDGDHRLSRPQDIALLLETVGRFG
jgi:pimeloyl-ACP methyl ester carboxylesterase